MIINLPKYQEDMHTSYYEHNIKKTNDDTKKYIPPHIRSRKNNVKTTKTIEVIYDVDISTLCYLPPIKKVSHITNRSKLHHIHDDMCEKCNLCVNKEPHDVDKCSCTRMYCEFKHCIKDTKVPNNTWEWLLMACSKGREICPITLEQLKIAYDLDIFNLFTNTGSGCDDAECKFHHVKKNCTRDECTRTNCLFRHVKQHHHTE